MLASVTEAREQWLELIRSTPIVSRAYTAGEINSDPRFMALGWWGSQIVQLLKLIALSRAQESVFPHGRPRNDVWSLVQQCVGEDDRFRLESALTVENAIRWMHRITNHLAKLNATADGREIDKAPF